MDRPDVGRSRCGYPTLTEHAVTIIVVTYNSARWRERQLASLVAQTDTRWRLVVVDNASDEAERPSARDFQVNAQIIQSEHNVGFAQANNMAAVDQTSPYLIFLNPDAFPKPGWLAALLETANRYPQAAAIGSTQLRADAPDVFDGVGAPRRLERVADARCRRCARRRRLSRRNISVRGVSRRAKSAVDILQMYARTHHVADVAHPFHRHDDGGHARANPQTRIWRMARNSCRTSGARTNLGDAPRGSASTQSLASQYRLSAGVVAGCATYAAGGNQKIPPKKLMIAALRSGRRGLQRPSISLVDRDSAGLAVGPTFS